MTNGLPCFVTLGDLKVEDGGGDAEKSFFLELKEDKEPTLEGAL